MNSIELITKYSTKAWDKVYKAEAISSLLDAPEAQMQFTGTKTVKIAKFGATGLGDYYRNNNGDDRVNNNTPFGYSSGQVGLTWEEFTIKCDRSAKYQIEQFDNEETDGLTLGAATTEISRTVIIPEVDAYCFSTIASYCSANLGNLVTGSISNAGGSGKTKPLAALNAALLYFDEREIPAEKQLILVSPRFMNELREDTGELSRYLMQSDYSKDVKFTLTSYEGRKFAVVPPQRFRTLIKLTQNGYGWDTGSQDIDFMVLATDAVVHVVKYNKVKIISGDMNLAGGNFDGYSIFARVYHDVFVQDNKRMAIYTHVGGFDQSAASTPKLDIQFKKGTTEVKSLTFFPGDKLVTIVTSNAAETVGEKVKGTTLTRVKVGDVLDNSAAAVKVYAIEGENVVAEFTLAKAE